MAKGPIGLLIVTGCAPLTQKSGDAILPSLSAVSSTLNADNTFRKRIWVGVGAGVSNLSPDVSNAPSVGVKEGTDAGGQLGMDVSVRVALELHAVRLGSAELSSGGVEYLHKGGSALMYFGSKHQVSRRKGLMPYARLGYGVLNASQGGNGVGRRQENSNELLLGAGVELFGMRDALGLRAEIISYRQDAQYAQVGLVYRFGVDQSPKRITSVATVDSLPVSAELIANVSDTIPMHTPFEWWLDNGFLKF